jgi:hypothetical protein
MCMLVSTRAHSVYRAKKRCFLVQLEDYLDRKIEDTCADLGIEP